MLKLYGDRFSATNMDTNSQDGESKVDVYVAMLRDEIQRNN